MFWENYAFLCQMVGKRPNVVAAELGKSSGSVTKWKHGTIPYKKTLSEIAKYFGVTVEELTSESLPQKFFTPAAMSDEALKFALWGDREMDDDDLEAVREYAAFIKERKQREKK